MSEATIDGVMGALQRLKDVSVPSSKSAHERKNWTDHAVSSLATR